MRIAHLVSPVAALLLSITGAQAQRLTTTINYPLGINGVAVDFFANKTYVLLPDYFALGQDAVQVLDGISHKVLATYPVPVATAIAVNVLGGTVYVSGAEPSSTNPSGTENVVIALNPRTGAIESTIPVSGSVGAGIVAMAVDPAHDKVLVSNASDNAIDVISGKSKEVVDQISLDGQTPAGIAVNPVTGVAYAALNNNQVAILRESNNWLSFATYGTQTSGVAVDPIQNDEYVTDGVFDNPTVGVLGHEGAVKASVPVGLFPQGIDVDYLRKHVFVANEADGTLTEFESRSPYKVISTTSVPANSVVVDPLKGYVYVLGSTTLSIFCE